MEDCYFKVVSIAHSAAQVGYVAVVLERVDDGGRFNAVFSVEDAKLLLEYLPDQVRIAEKQS